MFDYLVCILLSGGLFWYWLDFIVYPRCIALNSQCFYRTHRHWHTNKVSTLFIGNLFYVRSHVHTFYSYSKCYFLKSILPIFSILLCNFILFKRKYTRYRRITTSNTPYTIHRHIYMAIYRKQCSIRLMNYANWHDELSRYSRSPACLRVFFVFPIYFQLILFHSTLHWAKHKMLWNRRVSGEKYICTCWT